ncbi:MAG: multicopper oxidase family protein [Vicinamibacterales bacterium]
MHRRTALQILGLSSICAATHPYALAALLPAQKAAPPPDVELLLTASKGEAALLSGTPTRVWRYSGTLVRGPAGTLQPIEGSYLGPVIRLRRGQRVRVRFRNRLDEPSIVHWHGLDVPDRADGHPRLAVDAGGEYVYDFTVTNRAGTYWYHPHPHMRTAWQVYQGLAGFVLVSDEDEDALGLPSNEGELLWVLQDRRFDAGHQLEYLDSIGRPAAGGGRGGRGMGGAGGMRGMGGMRGAGMGMRGAMDAMNGWLGDRMLVSGRTPSALDVDRRTYRVRLLNGSNARIYKLAWSDGAPFTVLGGDGGLLPRVRTSRHLTLAPGQRADVLLDLSDHAAGDTVRLESVAFPSEHSGQTGMMGTPAPVPNGAPLVVATLRVSNRRGPRVAPPERLPAHSFTEAPRAPARRVPLAFMRMNWLIDGRVFDLDDVAPSETAVAGSTHVWEFVNQPNPMGMQMAHPMHMHGRQFRVLSRSGGRANALREGIVDDGWVDTVLVLPHETVRVQVTFSEHPGLYLYHCHILEHEDMGMMRNFRILAAG